MKSALPCDAMVSFLSPSTDSAGGADLPSDPVLPHEPDEPASLQDAQHWLNVYDEYLQNLAKLARQSDVESELQSWIDRCTRRRVYWAVARDRLQGMKGRKRAG